MDIVEFNRSDNVKQRFTIVVLPLLWWMSLVAASGQAALNDRNDNRGTVIVGNQTLTCDAASERIMKLISSDANESREIGYNELDAVQPLSALQGTPLLSQLYSSFDSTEDKFMQVRIAYYIKCLETNRASSSLRKALHHASHPVAQCTLAFVLADANELRKEDLDLAISACIAFVSDYRDYRNIARYAPPHCPIAIIKGIAKQAGLSSPLDEGGVFTKELGDTIRKWWQLNREKATAKFLSEQDTIIIFSNNRKLGREEAILEIDSLLASPDPKEQQKGIFMIKEAGDQLADSQYIDKLVDIADKTKDPDVYRASIHVLMKNKAASQARQCLYRQLTARNNTNEILGISVCLFQDPHVDEIDTVVAGMIRGFDWIATEQRNNRLDKTQLRGLDSFKGAVIELINAKATQYSIPALPDDVGNASYEELSQKINAWWKSNRLHMMTAMKSLTINASPQSRYAANTDGTLIERVANGHGIDTSKSKSPMVRDEEKAATSKSKGPSSMDNLASPVNVNIETENRKAKEGKRGQDPQVPSTMPVKPSIDVEPLPNTQPAETGELSLAPIPKVKQSPIDRDAKTDVPEKRKKWLVVCTVILIMVVIAAIYTKSRTRRY